MSLLRSDITFPVCHPSPFSEWHCKVIVLRERIKVQKLLFFAITFTLYPCFISSWYISFNYCRYFVIHQVIHKNEITHLYIFLVEEPIYSTFKIVCISMSCNFEVVKSIFRHVQFSIGLWRHNQLLNWQVQCKKRGENMYLCIMTWKLYTNANVLICEVQDSSFNLFFSVQHFYGDFN